MPTPEEILAGLETIASEAVAVAIAWHVAIAAAGVALYVGWRPTRRTAAVLLGLPAASVAVLALVFDNPFNGFVFALLAAALVALGLGVERRPVRPTGSRWPLVAGAAMIAFAWGYPHFLESRPAIAYLWAAPVGLIPCPTLSLMIGLALLGGGLGSRAWSLVLASAGAFYGIFGAAYLGVSIDLVLLAGALALAFTALRDERAG